MTNDTQDNTQEQDVNAGEQEESQQQVFNALLPTLHLAPSQPLEISADGQSVGQSIEEGEGSLIENGDAEEEEEQEEDDEQESEADAERRILAARREADEAIGKLARQLLSVATDGLYGNKTFVPGDWSRVVSVNRQNQIDMITFYPSQISVDPYVAESLHQTNRAKVKIARKLA